MNTSERLKEIGGFWLAMSAIVLALAALVGGTMALMMIWVSAQVAGFIWCGIMLVGVIAFFSWLIWDGGI